MKASYVSKVPASGANTLIAFLVSEENAKTTENFAAKHYGIAVSLSTELAESGRETLHISPDASFLFWGVGKAEEKAAEVLRKATYNCVERANDWKKPQLAMVYLSDKPDGAIQAITEAAILSNYQFLTYKSEKRVNALTEVLVFHENAAAEAEVVRGSKMAASTMIARNLVNEPVITLTATELSKRAEALAAEYGFSAEVFNLAKIKSLKMGGLLAVNYGSIEPPTFTIMEWKPEGALNQKPIVLVGKGVVYDTGGLSLKPTANSMDFMKSDMAGSAVVIATLCGAASLGLPLYIVGLVPATDNRPGQNAYVPGDVIKMFDGSTVEVLNTDAEGRMILADALAYAKKYDPELVIDLATLTGAAVVAVGTQGTAMMATAPVEVRQALSAAGMRVHERLVELPLWEEYGDQLKSDIADVKNIGGSAAGSITAGKFLERFTAYPWVHLDIAGPSFLHSQDSYRGKNGTGVGVRMLLDFLSHYGA